MLPVQPGIGYHRGIDHMGRHPFTGLLNGPDIQPVFHDSGKSLSAKPGKLLEAGGLAFPLTQEVLVGPFHALAQPDFGFPAKGFHPRNIE